ncbi:MAG: DUF167 domain-containing protein [Pseudomonadota bacterium]
MYRIGRRDADTIQIFLKVTPNAADDAVGHVERQADESLRLCLRVRAAPDNGAANTAVIKLLSRHFGLAKSGLTLTHGETSRLKTVVAPDSQALRDQLEALL